MSPRTTGALLALAAATGFGAMAVLAGVAYTAGADVHGLLLTRFTLAALLLLPLAAHQGLLPRGRDLWLLAALGGIGYVTQSLSYFGAVALAPASLVGILFGTYPILVALLDAAIHRRRPTPTLLLMATLAATGTALVAGPILTGNPLGATLALTAAVTYAIYISPEQPRPPE
ncbi:EamA family transporter [Crossiella cryophila]|uniref:Drug/metabolite transporter (DMT)-like permease n=1 Tax=Crossiella cryophila TaxID=43355 RepID=A0A7W7C716_9PSEU|nr:EamA family transporter [Crossiella cryophila]MBB4675671.1 drug/metabolite transporter (DMT)-like permease [Crossiella cryophila]